MLCPSVLPECRSQTEVRSYQIRIIRIQSVLGLRSMCHTFSRAPNHIFLFKCFRFNNPFLPRPSLWHRHCPGLSTTMLIPVQAQFPPVHSAALVEVWSGTGPLTFLSSQLFWTFRVGSSSSYYGTSAPPPMPLARRRPLTHHFFPPRPRSASSNESEELHQVS